jgi:Tol biopolymer transport system component
MLWLRDLDQVEPRRLEATAGASAPFWSPDSSHIGYRVDQTFWRIAKAGGQPTPICDGAVDVFSGSWGPDETIAFSNLTEIFEVPARGGEPKVLLEKDGTQEHHFHEVVWLPDGSGLLLVRHREAGKPADTITLWSDGRRTDLLTLESIGVANPRYSPSGHILFTRKSDNPGVWALPFSLSRLEVTGEPFLIVPDAGEASASADGTLVYLGDRTGRDVELVWFDTAGKVLEPIGQPQQDMSDPALSPDGTRIAVAAKEGNDWDIWIHDLEGNRKRLTFERGRESLPRWSPDGSRLFFHHPNEGASSVYSVASDGSEEPRRLAEGLEVSVDPGGGRIIFSRAGQDTGSDLWWLSLDDGQPVPFLQTQAIEEAPALSRDGRFLAYVSMEPEAEPRVYIRPFPEGSGEWQVANDHGYRPYWSPTGDRLYFNSNASLREVEVSTDPVLRLGTPRLMIDAQRTELETWRGISASTDGTRFVGIRPARDGGDAIDGIHVMESWLAEFGD